MFACVCFIWRSCFGYLFVIWEGSAKKVAHREHSVNSNEIACRAHPKTTKTATQVEGKNGETKKVENSMDFGPIWTLLLEAFGSVLKSKSRSKFGHDFGLLFRRIAGRDAALADRRRIVGAPAAQVPVPRIPRGQIL